MGGGRNLRSWGVAAAAAVGIFLGLMLLFNDVEAVKTRSSHGSNGTMDGSMRGTASRATGGAGASTRGTTMAAMNKENWGPERSMGGSSSRALRAKSNDSAGRSAGNNTIGDNDRRLSSLQLTNKQRNSRRGRARSFLQNGSMINWNCAGGKCMCPPGKRGERGYCSPVKGRQDHPGIFTAGQCSWDDYPRANYAYITARECTIVDVWAELQQRYLDQGPYNHGSPNPHSVIIHLKDLPTYQKESEKCDGDWRVIANVYCANEEKEGFLFVAQKDHKATLNCGAHTIKLLGPVTIGTGEACGSEYDAVKAECEGKSECIVELPDNHESLHKCREKERVAVFGTFLCGEPDEKGEGDNDFNSRKPPKGGINWYCAGGKCMCPKDTRGERGACSPVPNGREDNLGDYTAGQCSWEAYPRANYAYIVARTCTIVDVWAEVQQKYLDDGPYNHGSDNPHSVIIQMKDLPTYEVESKKCDGEWRIIANTYCADKESEGFLFVAQKDRKATLNCGSENIKIEGKVIIGTGEKCGKEYAGVKKLCEGKPECEVELPESHQSMHDCKELDRVAIFGSFLCGSFEQGGWESRPTPKGGIDWYCGGRKCMCPKDTRGERGFCTHVPNGREDNLGNYTAGQCHWDSYPRANYAYIVAKTCTIVDVWAEVQQKFLDEGPYNFGSANNHSVILYMKDLPTYETESEKCDGEWRIITNVYCAREDPEGFLFVAQKDKKATLKCFGDKFIHLERVMIGTGEGCAKEYDEPKKHCEDEFECEIELPAEHDKLHNCKDMDRIAVYGDWHCKERQQA